MIAKVTISIAFLTIASLYYFVKTDNTRHTIVSFCIGCLSAMGSEIAILFLGIH